MGLLQGTPLRRGFDGHINEARRAVRAQIYAAKLKSGSDLTDFFATMDELVLRLLGDMGETMSDEVSFDVVLDVVTDANEFRCIRDMHYRGSFPSVEHLKRTANNFYIDEQSRKSSASGVSGRGSTIAAASNNDKCHQCKAYGHFKRNYPSLVNKKSRSNHGKKTGKKRDGGDPSPKCCSYHKTNAHNDTECHKLNKIGGWLRTWWC